jgi:hypothetical protein
VVLEGALLQAGSRVFKLDEPFEWRATVFQESAGPVDACFQATWVRQRQQEIVFVSLGRLDDRPDEALHPAAFAPPPRAARVAVDRLFMLPLRHALRAAVRPASP